MASLGNAKQVFSAHLQMKKLDFGARERRFL